jgi:hypothetical protein
MQSRRYKAAGLAERSRGFITRGQALPLQFMLFSSYLCLES